MQVSMWQQYLKHPTGVVSAQTQCSPWRWRRRESQVSTALASAQGPKP